MVHFSQAFRKMIKRESGENPEQSRCCLFHKSVMNTTSCHWEASKPIGKAFIHGNESEDLPCNMFNSFRGRAMNPLICTQKVVYRKGYSYILVLFEAIWWKSNYQIEILMGKTMFQRFLCVVGMCSLLLPVEAQSSKNLRGINKATNNRNIVFRL